MPSNFRDKNGKDPFSDEQGENPFAEDGQDTPAATDDSPYAASAAPPISHQPGDFETILAHRGRQILTWAVSGLVIALAGLLVWYRFSLPAGVIGLVASLPACMLAAKDLRAMRMGAMDPSGKTMTFWGAFIGLAGTAVGGVSVILFLRSVAGLIPLPWF